MQYPLPSGYPPPGATYGGDQQPPPAGFSYPPGSFMAQHQHPVQGYHQQPPPPPEAQTFGPPYTHPQSPLDQSQAHQPAYNHPQSNMNHPTSYDYGTYNIPTDGQSISAALPYDFNPPGHVAPPIAHPPSATSTGRPIYYSQQRAHSSDQR